MSLVLICAFAFIAGFIDSIVGGGGLIQLPALFIFYPNLPVATLYGSNKFVAFSGTSVAAYRYVKKTRIPWEAVLPALVTATVFSLMGARIVSILNKETIKPLVLILLILVAIYTFFKKDFGLNHVPKLTKNKTIIYSLITGAVIGFYDGFFGPGTGSFLIVIFISVFGFSFLISSVAAKLVNCATNLAALAYFIYNGNIRYDIALPMAICNMAGSWLGAKIALEKGSAFIRILFLVIVTGMIIKFGYDVLF